jgi:hypothetical protein
MGIYIYHGLRWRNCVEDSGGPNLDLAIDFQRHRGDFRLLHVSRCEYCVVVTFSFFANIQSSPLARHLKKLTSFLLKMVRCWTVSINQILRRNVYMRWRTAHEMHLRQT